MSKGGKDGNDYVRQLMSHLISDEVAVLFNWEGRKHGDLWKQGFRDLSICLLIQRMFIIFYIQVRFFFFNLLYHLCALTDAAAVKFYEYSDHKAKVAIQNYLSGAQNRLNIKFQKQSERDQEANLDEVGDD